MTEVKQTEAMRRTAAATMQEKFERVYKEDPMLVNTAKLAVSMFFVDVDYTKLWTKQLSKIEGYYLSDKQRTHFIEHLIVQYSKLTSETMDHLTRVFVRGSHEDEGRSWWLDWPACLLRNFKEPGTYGCVDGVPRSGKTSVACTFMPIFNEKFHLDILTNIAIDDPPEYIHIAKKLSDLVVLMDEKEQWICILDETATFVDKKTALKTSNIDFENLARFVGKMNGRLLMISHSFEKDIPTRLQQWTTERYTKYSTKTMQCFLRGKLYKEYVTVKDLPDTTLNFRTEDITSLQFDISIELLLQDVQDGIPVKEALKRQQNKKSTKPTIIEAIKAYLAEHPKASLKEVAKACDCSPNYVGNIKSLYM
jgi:hypothetical protein